MIITGYHGTSEESADNIIKTKIFRLSQGDKEWLGSGIYFFVNYQDAVQWTKSNDIEKPAILHCIIEVQDDEWLDIDSDYGKDVYRKFSDMFEEIGAIFNTEQQNQCAVMNLIWKKKRKLKLLMESLPAEKTRLKTLTDARRRRKEFCVRTNEQIKDIVKLGVI